VASQQSIAVASGVDLDWRWHGARDLHREQKDQDNPDCEKIVERVRRTIPRHKAPCAANDTFVACVPVVAIAVVIVAVAVAIVALVALVAFVFKNPGYGTSSVAAEATPLVVTRVYVVYAGSVVLRKCRGS
jgi:hypothetical protein